MKANTRLFGEIDIADDKIITLEDGMIGLPEYRNFALIFDEEKEKDKSSVMWFQSMDDPHTARVKNYDALIATAEAVLDGTSDLLK